MQQDLLGRILRESNQQTNNILRRLTPNICHTSYITGSNFTILANIRKKQLQSHTHRRFLKSVNSLTLCIKYLTYVRA